MENEPVLFAALIRPVLDFILRLRSVLTFPIHGRRLSHFAFEGVAESEGVAVAGAIRDRRHFLFRANEKIAREEHAQMP